MPKNLDHRYFRSDKAERSALFAALNDQWAELATSRDLTAQLNGWATRHPVLVGFASGEQLMAVLHDVQADQELRRSLLEAVAAEADQYDLAMTTTLMALLPRLASLVNRTAHIDLDDRCATVLAIAHDVVLRCRPGTARSWYERRLWCNISKRYYRWVRRQCPRADRDSELIEVLSITGVEGDVDVYNPEVVDAMAVKPDPVGEQFQLAELCDWVAKRARVDLGTARLVVLSRAGGVPIEDLIDCDTTKLHSARRRRLRAERRLAEALSAQAA